MSYLSICIGQYGWRGLGFGVERWRHEIKPDGRWYPILSLNIWPVSIRWLRYSPEA